MFKKLVLVLAVSCAFIAMNCAKSNNVQGLPTPDEEVPIVTVDTLGSDNGDLGSVYLEIDLNQAVRPANDSNSLNKIAASNTINHSLNKVKHSQVAEVAITDSTNRVLKAEYPIDSAGKCNIGIIKILRGFAYQFTITIKGTTVCPWFPTDTLYALSNEYFYASDMADLRKNASDTLTLIFSENPVTKYFVTIKKPQGKYTEGKKYVVTESWNSGTPVPAVFSGGLLKHRINHQSRDTLGQFSLVDDTGKVVIIFSYNIDSVLNDDIIEAVAKFDEGGSIFINPIRWEWNDSLGLKSVARKDNGLAIYFNRQGPMSILESSILEIRTATDTTNQVKRTELSGKSGYIFWLPSTKPVAGTYIVKAGGFMDQYDKISPLVTVIVPLQ